MILITILHLIPRADIWSFGITALELAHGHAPFSKFPPMKVLLMTLQNAPPGLDYERDRKFSKVTSPHLTSQFFFTLLISPLFLTYIFLPSFQSFKQMIASCLVKDPSKRPSASKLLKHSFFKQARSSDIIVKKLLEGLPALGDRMEALKVPYYYHNFPPAPAPVFLCNLFYKLIFIS